MASTKPIIGLVGCGLLGSAIADRLAAAGFGVVAFDVDCARLDAVKAKRVETAASLADVAGRCRRIVLSLPDSDVVADVVEGDSGLAMGARRPTILIDTTTGDPEASGALAGRLETAGIAYLDAPVAGSSAQLRQGEAALIVGGDADALAACNDIFAALCDRMFHTGPAGSGARTKRLAHQVLGCNRLSLASARALADAEIGPGDVDPVVLSNMELFEGRAMPELWVGEGAFAAGNPCLPVATGGTSGPSAAITGLPQLASGLFDPALAAGSEQPSDAPTTPWYTPDPHQSRTRIYRPRNL